MSEITEAEIIEEAEYHLGLVDPLPAIDQVLDPKALWGLYSSMREIERFFTYFRLEESVDGVALPKHYDVVLLCRGVANILEDLARVVDNENVISMYPARPVLTWCLED